MEASDYFKLENDIYRQLNTNGWVINCTRQTMPKMCTDIPADARTQVSEDELNRLFDELRIFNPDTPYGALTSEQQREAHEKYSLIAPILPFACNEKERSSMINVVSTINRISKQTIRKYLCLYLTAGSIVCLASKHECAAKELTDDEKNFRKALGKYYYTQKKNTLVTAYEYMLRDFYTENGSLKDNYPPFHRFYYFYRKTRKLQTKIISRNGLSDYRRNYRPLLGSIHDFAPNVGVGMLDSTICDIYLVNAFGELVGRPVLTICVDAYSSLICGYALLWEGGVYSLQRLIYNVISDKREYCREFGINISDEQWPCHDLPGVIVTDKGSEYAGTTFEHIVELGAKLINLEAYRPELKGCVEKAFDLLQCYYKPHLKGHGVVEPDFQQRGAHDYRKDADLTLEQFEKIIIISIIEYNTARIIDALPATDKEVKPFANALWTYGADKPGANLIPVEEETLQLTLMPRATGRFTRRGLVVNKQRYRHTTGNYTEKYLGGCSAVVAYDAEDISRVWVFENGSYTEFVLILKIYDGLSLDEVIELESRKKSYIKRNEKSLLQSSLDYGREISNILAMTEKPANLSVTGITGTRAKEKIRRRINKDK